MYLTSKSLSSVKFYKNILCLIILVNRGSQRERERDRDRDAYYEDDEDLSLGGGGTSQGASYAKRDFIDSKFYFRFLL